MKQYLLLFLVWIQVICALPSAVQLRTENELSSPANVESTMVVAPRMRAQAQNEAILLQIDNFVNAYNQKRQMVQRRHDPNAPKAATTPALVPQKSALVAGQAAPPPGASIADQASEIGASIGRTIGNAIGSSIAGETLGGRVGETVGAPIGTRIGQAIGAAIDSFLQGQGI